MGTCAEPVDSMTGKAIGIVAHVNLAGSGSTTSKDQQSNGNGLIRATSGSSTTCETGVSADGSSPFPDMTGIIRGLANTLRTDCPGISLSHGGHRAPRRHATGARSHRSGDQSHPTVVVGCRAGLPYECATHTESVPPIPGTLVVWEWSSAMRTSTFGQSFTPDQRGEWSPGEDRVRPG